MEQDDPATGDINQRPFDGRPAWQGREEKCAAPAACRGQRETDDAPRRQSQPLRRLGPRAVSQHLPGRRPTELWIRHSDCPRGTEEGEEEQDAMLRRGGERGAAVIRAVRPATTARLSIVLHARCVTDGSVPATESRAGGGSISQTRRWKRQRHFPAGLADCWTG